MQRTTAMRQSVVTFTLGAVTATALLLSARISPPAANAQFHGSDACVAASACTSADSTVERVPPGVLQPVPGPMPAVSSTPSGTPHPMHAFPQ